MHWPRGSGWGAPGAERVSDGEGEADGGVGNVAPVRRRRDGGQQGCAPEGAEGLEGFNWNRQVPEMVFLWAEERVDARLNGTGPKSRGYSTGYALVSGIIYP